MPSAPSPTDHDNWDRFRRSNSDFDDIYTNDGRLDDGQQDGRATPSNNSTSNAPFSRTRSQTFDEPQAGMPAQAPNSPSRGVPDSRYSSPPLGQPQPIHRSSISVDINSNNVRYTNIRGVGNTHSILDDRDYPDSESSLSFDGFSSSNSFDRNSEASTPWAQNSGMGGAQPAIPHRQDNTEPRDTAVVGGQACPGYVVESYRLGDGTTYSSAHACEHNNARCERIRRQFGIEEEVDIAVEQPRESHLPSPGYGTPPRNELNELLREELRFEDGAERDHPPPYSPHPPQASQPRTARARQEYTNGPGAFTAFQVVDNGSGYTSQNISINDNNVNINTRVGRGNNGRSAFYSGIRDGRASAPPTSYTNENIRQGRMPRIPGVDPETMNPGPSFHFPDMSNMSQWIEQASLFAFAD